jgi:hypothetical protein
LSTSIFCAKREVEIKARMRVSFFIFSKFKVQRAKFRGLDSKFKEQRSNFKDQRFEL